MNAREASKRETPPERAFYGIADFATAMGISKSLVFKLLRSGELHARKCGRRTLISQEEKERYAASLPVSKAAA